MKIKTLKYIFAKTEIDISNRFSNDRSPIIKVSSNKIIFPKEINLGDLTLLDWFKQNPNELTFEHREYFSKEGPIIKNYYNPDWNLYQVFLDENEDFKIIENVKEEEPQFNSDIRQFNILQRNLETAFDYIEPTNSNKQVFSLQLRNIILLASMEVEVHWQKLLKNNGYRKDRLNTKDYVKLKEFINFKNEYKLTSFSEYGVICPFYKWNYEQPTKSLEWYDAYNKIKHDRSSNLHLAKLEQAVNSVSAVLTMLMIRYGKTNVEKKISKNLFSNTKHVYPSKYYHSKALFEFNKSLKFKKYFEENNYCQHGV